MTSSATVGGAVLPFLVGLVGVVVAVSLLIGVIYRGAREAEVRRLLGLVVAAGLLIVLSISKGVLSTTVRGALLFFLMGAATIGAGIYMVGLVSRSWPIWPRYLIIPACLVIMFGGYVAVMFAFWAVVEPRPWMIPKIVTTYEAFTAWLYLPAVPLTLATCFLVVRHARRLQLNTSRELALS